MTNSPAPACRNILIVEDDREFAEALAGRLERWGFPVTTAPDWTGAMLKLESGDFAVVVLGLSMPGNEGGAAIEKIRETKPLSKVILLYENGNLNLAKEGISHGAFHYVEKAVEIGDLARTINMAYADIADHDERIRKARFVRDKFQAAERKKALSDGRPTASGWLAVIGQEDAFSDELVRYALDLAERMSLGIIALSAIGQELMEENTQSIDRERRCHQFRKNSKRNAARLLKMAGERAIPFEHRVKFCERDPAVDLAAREIGRVEYVVSDCEEGLARGQICVYSLGP